MVFKLQLKSTALVLCVLLLSDHILEGLSLPDNPGEKDIEIEGELDMQHGKPSKEDKDGKEGEGDGDADDAKGGKSAKKGKKGGEESDGDEEGATGSKSGGKGKGGKKGKASDDDSGDGDGEEGAKEKAKKGKGKGKDGKGGKSGKKGEEEGGGDGDGGEEGEGGDDTDKGGKKGKAKGKGGKSGKGKGGDGEEEEDGEGSGGKSKKKKKSGDGDEGEGGDGEGGGEGGDGDDEGKKGKKGKAKVGKGGKSGKKGKDSSDVGLGKIGKAGGAIGGIVGSGGQTVKKGTMSGLARALDDRFIQVDLMGNAHGGVPEDLIGHVRMCAQVVYSGIYIILYLIIRYPLKILSKAILLTGSLGHIIGYANWCVNPISWMDWTSDGKKVNTHLERLVQMKDELKSRMIWVVDKARHEDKQMYACCALQEWKKKSTAEVPEAISYMEQYFTLLYKLCEVLYCMKYQYGSPACDEVDMSPSNEEPERILPQAHVPIWFELFNQFI